MLLNRSPFLSKQDHFALNSRIGILIDDFHDLSNWQWRIIEAVLDEPTLEFTLILQENKTQNQVRHSPIRDFFTRFSPNRTLFKIQKYIEQRVFFKAVFSVDTIELRTRLASVPTIEIEGQDSSKYDEITKTIIERLQQSNLDLIISLDSLCVPVRLAEGAKNGIWSFCFGSPVGAYYSPIGFNEVVQKESSIECRLISYSPNGQMQLVDHAFFNRGWSMVETATMASEGGVSILLKNLKKLRQGYNYPSYPHGQVKYKYPSLFQVMRYITTFYISLWDKLERRMAYRLWGQRHECWSVFIGKGNFLEGTPHGLKPLKMPKDEFWADPFLFNYGGEDYVFFENYSYKTNRGKISCGKVDGHQLLDIVDVLDLEYHLSFPFIFEEDGVIYLMPETSENKRLEIYRALDFPTKWELATTAFEGEQVADAFFFNDTQNQKWLFINKQMAETSPLNSELFIYKVDSVALNTILPHAQNPVIIDARVARNGGAIFEYENEYYRPSQRNTEGVYGRALNINRIKKLTLETYEEENVRIVEPDFDKNLMATHHLHQTDKLFVFDAAYKAK